MKYKRITVLIVAVVVSFMIITQWVVAVPPNQGDVSPKATVGLTQDPAYQVRINEVLSNPGDGAYEWVELAVNQGEIVIYLPLVMKSGADAQIAESRSSDPALATGAAFAVGGTSMAGWEVTDEDGNIYTIPEALPPVPFGAFVLILFDGMGEDANDYDFSDGRAELHTQPGLVDIFENNADQVSLYASSDHTADTIRDFVAYGAPAGEDGTNANEAGLWRSSWHVSLDNGSGLESAVHLKAPGDSIGRLPVNLDAEVLPEDWAVYQGEDRTPGAVNPVPSIYWSTGFDGMMMSTDGFALGWGYVTGATYHFQMDDNEDFSSLEVDEILDNPSYVPEEGPAIGSYFWRVRAVDSEGHASAWSDPMVVGVREGEEGLESPTAIQQVVLSKLTWLRQRKDTRLLCVDGDARGNPDNDPSVLENAWDTVHPDAIFTHGQKNCVRASIAMGVTTYNGDISQDRISYQMFEVWGDPSNAEVGSPLGDLGHNSGTCMGGSDGCTSMRLIEWVLGVISTTVDYESHSCGFDPQGTTDHPTFTDIQSWINAGRPILEGHVNCHNVIDNPATPKVNENCACSGHATIIGGFRVLTDGTQQIRNFDPWSAVTWVDYNDDTSTTADETFYVDWAYALPASAPNVRSDETSIWTDSDGDGIMDFDEFTRFSSLASTPDSDEDWVDDKSDLAEVYFNTAGNYLPKTQGPDMDNDGLDKEVDPDNDGGGTVDGCEDFDYDGRQDTGETSNFSSSDDTTCVPAFEIRYPTTTATAEAGDKASPNKLLIRVLASIPPAAGTLSLTASDFEVEVQDESASILLPPYRVGDEYWLIVQPPVKTTAAGYYNLWVKLQGSQTDLEINAIHYSDSARAPVDEVLLIDNSGSMAQYNKMVSTKNAARAFVDRWVTQDMVGLVAFSTTVSIPFPLTEVTGTITLTNARTAINSMPDSPDPYWYTAIGSGLLNAKTQLASSSGGHPQSIILLSDGQENMNPKWSNPTSGVQAAFKNCNIKVHTVVIGPSNASYRALLQEISQKACNGDGISWHTSGGGTSPTLLETGSTLTAGFPTDLGNRLADIYLSIAELDAGHQRLWEATSVVGRGFPDNYAVSIPDGLPEAVWTVNWDIGLVALELQDPDGQPVIEGDPGVTRIRDATHDQFRISNPREGIWHVAIQNIGPEDFSEYLAVLSGRSNPQMWLLYGLMPQDRVTGARLPIHVALADTMAIPGANLEISIKAPVPGLDQTFNLFDDGGHEDQEPDDGLYGNPAYYELELAGSYTIKAVATGTDNNGFPFELYLTRSFYVTPRLAYIFNPENPDDVETAISYSQLLGTNGFRVDMIPLEAVVASTNLDGYVLVVIGPGTGDMDEWGTTQAVALIAETGLPVIGLGDGGYAFFGKLGLDIGYANGAHGSENQIYVEDTGSDVWADPYPVTIPGDQVIELYQVANSLVEIFAETLPDDAVSIGRDVTDSSYYHIIQQATRFVLWGYNGSPELMTETGQEVFVNLAWYME